MFKVATFNVKSTPLMPQKHVVHDVLMAARNSDVIFWQEIHPNRYMAAIRELGDEWQHYRPGDSGEFVSWRRRKFHFIEGGSNLLHTGVKGMINRRVIPWVRLRRKGSRRHVVFHSVHYISRGFDTDGSPHIRKDPKVAAQQAIRQAAWYEANARHREWIDKWVKQGVTVIGGGDFNRAGNKAVVGHKFSGIPVQYVDAAGGLDYLFVIPGKNTECIEHGAKNFNGFSDHPLKTATVALRRPNPLRRSKPKHKRTPKHK